MQQRNKQKILCRRISTVILNTVISDSFAYPSRWRRNPWLGLELKFFEFLWAWKCSWGRKDCVMNPFIWNYSHLLLSLAIAFQPTTVRSCVDFSSRTSLALLGNRLVHFQANSNIQWFCFLLFLYPCCYHTHTLYHTAKFNRKYKMKSAHIMSWRVFLKELTF